MEVTHERNTLSRTRNTEGLHYIDYELFDSLMNARKIFKATARIEKVKTSRSTYYRVINHEVGVTLRVAMQFATAANTTVSQLFPHVSPKPRAAESDLHPIHAEARGRMCRP